MAKLTIRAAEGQSRDVDLTDRDLRIGRGEQNDIVLPDATKSVSRVHAELRCENGQYVLVDADSQNGLWVGEKRVRSVTLQPGVPVLVGSYTLVLEGEPVVAETMAGGLPTIVSGSVAPPVRGATAAKSAGPAPTRKAPSTGPRPALKLPVVAAIAVAAVAIVAILAVALVVVRRRHAAEEQEARRVAEAAKLVELPPPVPPVPTAEQQVHDHLELARTHFEAGEFGDASSEADQVLQLDPSNADASDLKGKADAELQKLAHNPPPSAKPDPAAAQPAKPQPSRGSTPAAPPAAPPPAQASEGKAKRLQDLYERGSAALQARSYQEAIERFTALLNEEPYYKDTSSLREQAKYGLEAAMRASVEEGARLEKGGDLRGAVNQYRRAQPMGAAVAGDIDRIVKRMQREGAQAFKDAETYFAYRKLKEAIERYERAIDYLPDDDPNKRIAKEKLESLKGRP